ncbi:MAG TPA: chromosome segregation protein SMC, partial [Bacteroidetes bacterium]|nr:chromosome segregation protein SMC [Bacteroidota bacterium]
EEDTLSKNTFVGTSSQHKITEVLKSKKLKNNDDGELKDLFQKIYSRIFIDKKELVRIKINGNQKLRIDAGNLASVLKRIIEDPLKKEEIIEWLQLLIPEFEDLQISRDNISGIDTLLVKEKHTKQYFQKDLLSDGTYNILSLLTAVYQSDEPQFLCIEEPENGLNPYVIRELVGFFRQLCEEKGHYIWLNTHSPTLVKELQPKELILINKIGGETKAKQVDKNLKFKSMPLDEAWLTNTLGGGLPW